ncbi:MAG: hypothetical protein LBH86_09430, partial [Oscillospiraceae bacterium]|nr:hypothetical protein [Oscillospiraceae bacterium]
MSVAAETECPQTRIAIPMATQTDLIYYKGGDNTLKPHTKVTLIALISIVIICIIYNYFAYPYHKEDLENAARNVVS